MWVHARSLAGASWLAVTAVVLGLAQPTATDRLAMRPAAAVNAGKIMIVGDSITHGSSGDWTWRYRLARHLSASGVTYDFIGPHDDLYDIMTSDPNDGDHTYADPAFDQDHDAKWGQPLGFEMNEIGGKVTTYQPGYLLVLLGINDLGFFGETGAQVEASLRTFIANARASKADVRFVFCKLLPTQRAADDAEFAGRVADYNLRLASVAQELGTAQSPIAVADASAEFVPATMTWDGTHPNGRGELRIAAAFADALAQRFGVGAAYPRPYPDVVVGPQQAPQATVTSTGPGTADLAWTPSLGATAYWVWTRDPFFNPDWTRLPIPLSSDYDPWHMTGLVAGATYSWKLQATKGNDAGAFSNEVTLTVPGDTPAAPTNFAVSGGDKQATLSWTPSASATGYFIHVRNVTLGETEFTKLPFPVPGPQWVAEMLINGATYEFEVQAVNGLILGGTTAAVSVTPTGPTPAGVTDLSVTNGSGEATLRWTEVPNATGYYVHVRNVTLGETSFTRLPFPVPGPEWTAGLLVNGATYEFRLQSANGLIAGGMSNTVTARPTVAPPAGPTNLTAAAGNGEATLRWTEAADATGYFVHVRNVTAGETAFTRLPFPVSGAQWAAGLLVNGATYEFKLQSVSGLVEGGFSNTVTVRPTVAPPAGPTGLTATAGNHEAALHWTEAANATGYFVHVRNVTAGETTFTKLPFPVPGSDWTAGLLTNGATYEFKLQSVSGLIEGGFSNTVTVKPTGPAPVAPTNFAARAGDRKAVLTWDMPANATCVYILTRNVTAGETSFTRLPYPVCDDTWTAGSLVNGATYEFKLQAYNDLIPGGTTAAVSVRPTAPPPPAPENLTATRGDQKATLQWTGSSQATGYFIWVRNVTNGEAFQKLPYPVADDHWTAGLLINGATYEFKVQSVDGLIPGGFSNTVSVVPLGPTPQVSNLRVSPRLGEATLSWSASSTATGYMVILRDVSNGESFHELPFPVTGSSWTAGLLIPGHTYEFKLQAVSGLQRGVFSNTVSVTMPLPAAPTGMTARAGGPYEAKLSWNPVPGADGYIIYHGVSNAVWDIPTLTPLPFPVSGTNFTAGYLVQPGIHWFAVAATKYGGVGPKSGLATMSPLMENVDYFDARWRYFDSVPASGDTKLSMAGPRGTVDGGIVVVRAFIAPEGIYAPISDDRTYNAHPYASARMHLAWDTGRAEVTAYAQKSCVFSLCHGALPIVESTAAQDARDGSTVHYNYVWTSGSADNLTADWSASNSDTAGIWALSAHIDTNISIWRASGSSFAASLYTDHFPSYEAYQYPHYTVNGFPEARVLLQCGQFNIDGLYDSPSERRAC